MTITEEEARELWKRGRGSLPPFPPGTRFSPAAADFLSSILAAVPPARGGVSEAPSPAAPGEGGVPAWDRPAAFVVDTGSEALERERASPAEEYQTQLGHGEFGSKRDPRIALRAALDSLNADFLLASSKTRALGLAELSLLVDSLGAYGREIASAEYGGREPAPLSLAGMDEDFLHDASREPGRLLGCGHIAPSGGSPEPLLLLNALRARIREAELASLPLERPGLARALNRVSTAVYVTELILHKAAASAAGEQGS
jgi:ethanolamine utilization cobalamin adenosyltransferase